MHAPLQGLVRALAGVDVAVHVLGDVYLQLQRGHGAAPEARLRRVVDTWRGGKITLEVHPFAGSGF